MNRIAALSKVTALDIRLFFWCTSGAQRTRFTRIARQISRLGDGPLYATTGLTLALLDGSRGTMLLMLGLISYTIELPVYAVLKNTIRRARPCHRFSDRPSVIEPSDTFSFPSGHSAAAALFASLICMTYEGMVIPMTILACAIGASRVVLGVHYPTDIIAGATLGVLSALLGVHFYSYL